MIRKIILNNREITYNLHYKSVKRLIVRIKSDSSVYVSAPKRASLSEIEAFLQKKSSFILNAVDEYSKQAKNLPPPIQYFNGDKIYYLGELSEIEVLKSKKKFVDVCCGGIKLYVPEPDNIDMKKDVIDKWRKETTDRIVTKLCEKYYSVFSEHIAGFPKIKFRKMISRWGSCRPMNNSLTFNTYLAEVPIECIEYVVVHELTHFVHPNHSPAFYDKVSEILPDYRKREKTLKKLERDIIRI